MILKTTVLFLSMIIGVLCASEQCGKTDLLIILDSSDSVDAEEFNSAKESLVKLVSNFKISPKDSRFSVIGYGTTTKLNFLFDQYQDKQSLIGALKSLKQVRGATATGLALELALKEVVPFYRTGIRKILLLITDGRNNRYPPPHVIAPKLQKEGVFILTVSIGNSTNKQELIKISSDQDVTEVATYKDIVKKMDGVIETLCGRPEKDLTIVPLTTQFIPETTTDRVIAKTIEPRPEGTTEFIPETTREPIIRRTDEQRPEGTTTTGPIIRRTDEPRPEGTTTTGPIIRSTDEPRPEGTTEFIPETTKEPIIRRTDEPRLEGTSTRGPIIRRTDEPRPEGTTEFVPETTKEPIIRRTDEPRPEGTSTRGPIIRSTDEPRPEGTTEFIPETTKESIIRRTDEPRPEETTIRTTVQEESQTTLEAIQTTQQEVPTTEQRRPELKTTAKIVEPPITDGKCKKKLDVIFLLDSSSSLYHHWSKELELTNRIIDKLHVGPQETQIGLMHYSDIIEVGVQLGSMHDAKKIKEKIRKLWLLEGSTFIGEALIAVGKMMEKHGRKGADKTVVLFTDGASNSLQTDPQVEAQKLKEKGYRMVVVGLGTNIQKKQLKNMSSSETFISIKDMNKMLEIDPQEISDETCKKPKPLPTCIAILDILLVLDTSTQIMKEDWDKMINFASDLSKQFVLSDANSRIGVMSFSNSAEVNLKFSTKISDVVGALYNLKHNGGYTNIESGLKTARKTFYLHSDNDKQKLVILLSNGFSLKRAKSIGESYDLQARGINLMTVGMGKSANVEELKLLASPGLHVSRQGVKHIKTLLKQTIILSCASRPKENDRNVCESNGDIVFIVDKSTDISPNNWESIRSIFLTTISHFNITKGNTRISLITYSDRVKADIRLDENFSPRDIYVAVKQLRQKGNGGRMATALHRARQVFKISHRYNTGKVAIIMTDKLPTNQKDTLRAAKLLMSEGIQVITVGTTKSAPYDFFKEIASKKSVIRIENINKIEKYTQQIKVATCQNFLNKQEECSQKKLDVVVVMDRSSSIGPDNWQIQLDFINRIVENLDLRPDRTMLGLFTFGTFVDLHIPLNSSYNNEEMQNKVKEISYSEGLTAIGESIKVGSNHLLRYGRKDVPKVLLVVTDGSNTAGKPPQIPAVTAKKTGIKIISVGIGSSISEKELIDISSAGKFYDVKDFQDLEKYNAKIITNDACQIPEKPKICRGKGDLIFILGSDSPPDSARFKKMSLFMKSLTRLTFISPNFTRVAVLKFNKGAYMDSGFTVDQKKFEASIQTMTSSTNGVYIGKALTRAGHLFGRDKRANATKTVIIISDSKIYDKNRTFTEAERLKKMGIKIITLGLSDKVDMSNLRKVASTDRALTVADFKNLQNYNGFIASEICEVIKGTSKECNNKKLELMIALDSSSSIGPTHWKTQLLFVQKIVKDMDVGKDLTRVGLVTFNTVVYKEFGLKRYSDKYDLTAAINKLEYSEGLTAIGDALRSCKLELMNNSRRGVPRVILLVTDGVAQGGISPEVESTLIKKFGIKIIVVGIGDSISAFQLKALSSSNKFHTVMDFHSLKDFDPYQIIKESCKAGMETK